MPLSSIRPESPSSPAASLPAQPWFVFNPWVWRMAWRDSRKSRGRLLVFSTALTLGVAALVAIGSIGWNVERAIQQQARNLLGADLEIESRQRPDAAAQKLIDSLGGTQAGETRLVSMAQFPKSGDARLVQVHAVEGGFPFYGSLETDPATAAAAFARGEGALVDESLLLLYGLHPGDPIRIAGKTWPILGSVRKLPGEFNSNPFSSIAPRVLIPRADLPPALLNRGSIVRYMTYLKLPAGVDVDKLVARHRDEFKRDNLETNTVTRRKQQLGRVFTNVTHFLNLVSFVALLLGGIGVASAIHAHLKQKLRTVAVLRCLGASASQTLAIYLIQALSLGLAGALSGALLGIAIQGLAPWFLKDALPVELGFAISWAAVAEGIGVGFLTCAIFILLPLLPVRRTPPLLALRSAFETSAAPAARRDPLVWLAYALLGAALIGFPWLQSRDARLGLGFSAALFISFALLAAVAKLLMVGARRFFPKNWAFEWRQGLANLYRPNNRTGVLVFTLGLSTFLLLGLHLTRNAMLRQFAVREGSANQPNLVFFDIQPDQRDALAAIIRAHHLPVLDTVPVVTMHLTSIRGRSINELAAEAPPRGRPPMPNWRLRHEYRSTYRDHLNDAETIQAGRWQRAAPAGAGTDAAHPVPVSVEAEMARDLRLNVGDPMVFDVQGVPIYTVVGSLRKVDWTHFEPNFFVVFPTGVLEAAPAFNIMVTRTDSAAASAAVQRDAVRQFPTVSALDFSLVVATIKGIVDKASAAVRFLSVFTVGTGLLVVAAAILTGRYERIRESVLLRTLGASRRQIFRILAIEYFCLGTLSALTGIVLAAAGSWVLAARVFKVPWAPSPLAMAGAWVIVAALTVGIGLLASRGVCDHPPLEVLRAEE
jgi:putative ABC transport system permease protein